MASLIVGGAVVKRMIACLLLVGLASTEALAQESGGHPVERHTEERARPDESGGRVAEDNEERKAAKRALQGQTGDSQRSASSLKIDVSPPLPPPPPPRVLKIRNQGAPRLRALEPPLINQLRIVGDDVPLKGAGWSSMRFHTKELESPALATRLADQLRAHALWSAEVYLTIPRDLPAPQRAALDNQLAAVADLLDKHGKTLVVGVDPDRIRERTEQLRKTTIAADTTAIVADPAFHVLDGKAIQNITTELKGANVSVQRFDGTSASLTKVHGSTVVVISGHSSDELGKFVAQLAESKVLDGKIVIFASCGTELTPAMVDQMVDSGAHAVIHFAGPITSVQVTDVARSLVKARAANPKTTLPDFMREVRRTLGLRHINRVSILVRPATGVMA